MDVGDESDDVQAPRGDVGALFGAAQLYPAHDPGDQACHPRGPPKPP